MAGAQPDDRARLDRERRRILRTERGRRADGVERARRRTVERGDHRRRRIVGVDGAIQQAHRVLAVPAARESREPDHHGGGRRRPGQRLALALRARVPVVRVGRDPLVQETRRTARWRDLPQARAAHQHGRSHALAPRDLEERGERRVVRGRVRTRPGPRWGATSGWSAAVWTIASHPRIWSAYVDARSSSCPRLWSMRRSSWSARSAASRAEYTVRARDRHGACRAARATAPLTRRPRGAGTGTRARRASARDRTATRPTGRPIARGGARCPRQRRTRPRRRAARGSRSCPRPRDQ